MNGRELVKFLDVELKRRGIPKGLNEHDGKEEEPDELREMLRSRQDLRILLKSASDVPPSSVYALVSQIEKMKENNT